LHVPILPAAATCLALILYLIVFLNVVRARRRYDVKAPATTGDPAFERVYRVQVNMVEQLVLFLPSIWLCAYFSSPTWAGVLGFVWVAARLLYTWSYYRDPATRGPAFIVSAAASAMLLISATAGVLGAMSRTGL
jgi:glutathione S-transferase